MIRHEYPRPDIVRSSWWPLNGTWAFSFDDDNRGLNEEWYRNPKFPLRIEVPFAFQSSLSGIHDSRFHDRMWYHRTFKVTPFKPDKRYLLHFQAVDYECRVYLDGRLLGEHIGGQAPFSFEITQFIEDGKDHDLVVYAHDPSTDLFLPRGKQYWKETSESIWYTRTSGIYQSVWIEEVPTKYVESVKLTPSYDEGVMNMEFEVSNIGATIHVEIFDQGKCIIDVSKVATALNVSIPVQIFKGKDDFASKSWSPENPYIYDVTIKYGDDLLTTYFGMRKVHTEAGRIYLNNKPYYLKMILDQGYWPDGLLTAPSIEAIARDILLAKEMGFNGARKHQKCEDPYFAYNADRLGFIVWGEMASAVDFSDLSAARDINEWRQIIPRDYNHPSIIAWVPLNESWGVPDIRFDKRQQRHAIELYDLIKSMDDTRLVVGNDGWEMVKTDICAVHHYRHGNKNDMETQTRFVDELATKEAILKSRPADRPLYAEGYHHNGQPIMLTEFGGISYVVSDEGWGYTNVNNGHDLVEEYRRLILAIKNSDAICGYCYTQLTDVEFEVNGLLTYNRRPKIPLASIKEINDLIDFK